MKTRIPSLILLAVLHAGCEKDFSDHWPCIPPEDISDGLDTGTPEEADIDKGMLLKAVGRIYREKYKEVHAILIYKDGLMVFEEYNPGHAYQWDASSHHGEWTTWDRDMPHNIMSASRSFTSACIAIWRATCYGPSGIKYGGCIHRRQLPYPPTSV